MIEHKEYGEVLQLQGDQRLKIRDWLKNTGLVSLDQLKVHGFWMLLVLYRLCINQLLHVWPIYITNEDLDAISLASPQAENIFI